ncbi:single-stranded DNA-binding protein [Listeria sp. SHR_NRA_18]|uniref:single-stranded DNA-binding protein n=1 Tax=Listeria sp. SHR_NRA_18 TaxID=2269046 RepID=UPI000F5DFB66|nr:single-stranded DNA-binding protein [Listeria sp. SHR_NRA_18]RQW65336.1 single-stranded DNA-binding protein [Listeria sp. SHR_NRA_18]
MMNRVVLVGRLTKDPELRYTPAGVAVATFTLAVNRNFTNQAGEREADFINCVIWRKPAENVANFLKKGSLAGVDGKVQTRNYEGQDGKRVYVTEVLAESVQFLEPRGTGATNNQPSSAPNQAPTPQQQTANTSNQGQAVGAGGATTYTPSGYPKNADPFAAGAKSIEINDDDLPF